MTSVVAVDRSDADMDKYPHEVIEKITVEIKLDDGSLKDLAFVLQEAYSTWGAQFNHHSREGHYADEVMKLLDMLDDVHEQLADQGYGWETDE